MMEQHQQWEPAKNYAIGVAGMSIGLADVTNFFQAVGIIAGAILVCIQLYRSLTKR